MKTGSLTKVLVLFFFVTCVLIIEVSARKKEKSEADKCAFLDWKGNGLKHQYKALKSKAKSLKNKLAKEARKVNLTREQVTMYDNPCKEQFSPFSYTYYVQCQSDVIRRLRSFSELLEIPKRGLSRRVSKELQKTIDALKSFLRQTETLSNEKAKEKDKAPDSCNDPPSGTDEDRCVTAIRDSAVNRDSKREAALVLAHELKTLVDSLNARKCRRALSKRAKKNRNKRRSRNAKKGKRQKRDKKKRCKDETSDGKSGGKKRRCRNRQRNQRKRKQKSET